MAKTIIWTDNAKSDFFFILEYLEKEWSFQIADNFSGLVERKVELLSQFPQLGAASQKYPDKRKITLTRHNILIYSIVGNHLVLLSFFDTRRNPANRNF